jgi:hypothetical protein
MGYPGPDSAPERAVRIGEYYILPSKWKLKKITCPPTPTGLDIGYPEPDSAPERAVRV